MIQWKELYRFLFILTVLALTVLLRNVLLIVFLGLLVSVAFCFPMRFLCRYTSRGIALTVTLFLTLSTVGGVGYLIYRPVSEQVIQLEEQIPEAIHRAKGWFKKNERNNPVPQISPGQGMDVESILSRTGQAAMSLTSVVIGLVVTLVLAAFFAYEPLSYQEGFRALIPEKFDIEFEVLWKRISQGLRHWLRGILISMTIMGVLTGIGLMIAGIQEWFLLGILTFVATFVPYVGAIASSIPGLIIALSQSTEKLGEALVVYIVIHIIEGYLVEPLIMKKAVFIRPATLLVWQLIMGVLAGALGIIAATPLLVCVKIIVGQLYIEDKLGKHTSQV